MNTRPLSQMDQRPVHSNSQPNEHKLHSPHTRTARSSEGRLKAFGTTLATVGRVPVIVSVARLFTAEVMDLACDGNMYQQKEPAEAAPATSRSPVNRLPMFIIARYRQWQSTWWFDLNWNLSWLDLWFEQTTSLVESNAVYYNLYW